MAGWFPNQGVVASNAGTRKIMAGQPTPPQHNLLWSGLMKNPLVSLHKADY